MTTATTNDDIRGTLYMAFELGWGKWKLAFTVGRGQKPRVRTIDARDLEAVQTELFSWRKFSNRKQVGSIAGLTGTPFDSGVGNGRTLPANSLTNVAP